MAAGLLIVVRHARTEWNATGRFQGHADPPLDEVGARQASECAAALASAVHRAGIANFRLITSDLRRAADTAREIAAVLAVPLQRDPMLREVDVGSWEGLTREEAEALFPDEYRRWAGGSDIRRGGGETLGEAGRRIADRIGPELRPGGDEVLVVVGHGMALQSGLGWLRTRGHVIFDGEAPHLGNARWLAVSTPGQDPPPLA